MPLSGRDAVRIARAQALSLEQFVDVVSESDSTRTGFRLDGGADTFTLALLRHPDGACPFLLGLTDGSERCGIYPHRPGTCAAFPLRLREGSVEIRDDVICDPAGRGMAGVDLPAAKANMLRAAFEWELYERVVAVWNVACDGPIGNVDHRAYFTYVGLAYDTIDRARSEPTGETLAATVETAIGGIAKEILWRRGDSNP